MRLTTMLALGLLLTTATKLRVPGLPIGPGEILLVSWITLTLLRALYRHDRPLTADFRRMVLFWVWFTIAEALGTLTALVLREKHDSALFLHDVMAYPLVGAVACLSVLGQDAPARLSRTARAMVAWGSLLLAPQLAAGWHLVLLPWIDPWFGDRFEGWSTNPNQMALLCAVLVFAAMHLADIAPSNRARIGAAAGLFVPLLIGHLTRTDTFTFALLVGVPVFAAAKLRQWMSWSGRRDSLRPVLARLAILMLPLVLLSALPFAVRATPDAVHLVVGMMKNGGTEAKAETDLRLALWREAIARGVHSGFLGLGPGPHLPIPPDLVAARENEMTLDKGAGHPPVNGTQDFEAHNTLLDLFTQGGVIAGAAFVWLAGCALVRSWRAQSAGLVALWFGLVMFASTNLMVREPTFWFGITLCLVAARAEMRRPVSRSGV